jgi:hypothetical protein
MKTIFTLFISLSTFLLTGQTIFFEQNFEENADHFYAGYTGTNPISDGSPQCGFVSRGTTADMNSPSIDFNSSENPGSFIGMNPESPCGGFYQARIRSFEFSTIDADTLFFLCKYFISSGLNWGPAFIDIEVSLGTSTYLVNNEIFDVTNSWTQMVIGIPSTVIGDSTKFTIDMGGGEGVGIDDIRITDTPDLITSNSSETNNSIEVFPTVTSGILEISNLPTKANSIRIYNIQGTVIKEIENTQSNLLDITDLSKGTYLVQFEQDGVILSSHRVIKE